MTKDDIIRMARESEWLSKYDSSTGFSAEVAIRFAALVAAHTLSELEHLPGRQQVQVPVAEFVEMVLEKEHLVGKPLVWAQWPNKEKNT